MFAMLFIGLAIGTIFGICTTFPRYEKEINRLQMLLRDAYVDLNKLENK